MREIKLSQNKVTLVDDELYKYLNKFKWTVSNTGDKIYATTHTHNGIKKTSIRMHRFIMNPKKGLEVDHINGDGLDNRKENLRVVTRRTNAQNHHGHKTSRFVGVSWYKADRHWHSKITIDRRKIYLGCFKNEDDAARIYNAYSKIDEFSRTHVVGGCTCD